MGCEKCSGNCAGCGGGAGSMELTQGEVHILQMLGQFSFLPAARKREDMIPVFLEDTEFSREEYSLILQCLEKKALIRLDYDAPLTGADMSAYGGYPVHGSMALTQRGYAVLELLETLGIEE
ncbi:MAG: hypothetical protein IJO45_06055 [Oscillospiraceae bacterium]|nr:hypothetical protein [Oscillospiraceae bacterium]